jgi:predicted DCC family thiol-disulfide oxidoreductase YuxK
MSGAASPGARGFTRLVLFDGVCGFCDGAVRWLIARDAEGQLRFAPLQGLTAARLRERHPEIPHDLDTLVYVDASQGVERVYLRSEAVFLACRQVDPRNRWLRWLSRLPRPLADLGYRGFARMRYRVFGKLEACRVPRADERQRFLD